MDSTEIINGLTSYTPESTDAARLIGVQPHPLEHGSLPLHPRLELGRRLLHPPFRTGHGPENMTRLRRFIIGLIKSRSSDSAVATLRKHSRNVRHVFVYLRMTDNATLGS